MDQHKITSSEMRLLQEALSADYKIGNIRLREGEYQYSLAKAIASFQLELHFPDVKDIVKRLYGEEKTSDIQFIRKIQTILKKMEKSNIVQILPKKMPWDLQRYALTSFKFQDVDKNFVVLVTEQQLGQAKNLLSQQEMPTTRLGNIRIKVFILAFVVLASYTLIVWDLTQSTVHPTIFISAFSIAVICSLMLGKLLSQK